MKKLLLYTLLFSSASLVSCKKYLDKEPDNRTTIKTPEQIAQLLTTAYPQATYLLFAESMSDNVEDKGGGSAGIDFTDKINRQSYRYEVVETSPEDLDSPDFYWNACYKAIAAANQAIEIIDASPNKSALTAHRGEALLARAYAHFMLVTFFSKVYDPATAANDPGIPYVTARETTVFAKYERKTVASVYEMIEKDLKEGLPLIDDRIYGTAPKFHFNRNAAAAFAARFYLFKRDYNSVITYANQVLGTTPADKLRPWNTTLKSMQYLELQAEYTRSSLQGNLLLQEANSVWGRSYASLRYGLGPKVANAILFSTNVSGWYYAYPVYGTERFYNIPKFYEHFVTETINANSGNPFNTIPLFSAEEVLLNRAEAYLRTSNSAAAINDINAFLSKNIDDYDPSTDNITAAKASAYYGQSAANSLLLAILDFKRAFFMHEGLRWLDILRLKIPVTHTTTEGQSITLTANDPRRVLQLPVLTRQAGLEPNPR
jgi:starch-binding outer membrane protein, SusD/RagB family